MNELYKKVNELSNGKYRALRFPCVTFGKDTAVITVKCGVAEKAFANKNFVELAEYIGEACGFNTRVELNLTVCDPTAYELRTAVVKFTEKFSYVSSMMHTVEAEIEPTPTVRMKMHAAMYDLAKDDYIPRLKEFLENNYTEQITTDVQIVEYSESGTAYSVGGDVTKTEYSLTDVKPIVGGLKPVTARSIASISQSEYNVCVCGILVMPTTFTSKNGYPYVKFLLYDGDLTLQCRFSAAGGASVIGPEYINKSVCVLGNVEYESARNEATVNVREISLCNADGLKVIPQRPEPKAYNVVSPQSYEVLVQSSMFDADSFLPNSLVGDFVVFDFETTGLSVLYDRPTELGAVKISDGKLKESFSTLIDPRREIPQEVVEKTGITNEMVKGKPLFEDILPDFYKFTYGCSVVCHNIAFDFPFLIRSGNRSGWAFGDRRTHDTMGIAPKAIPGIARLSLERVIEELGLQNDNAHRAVSDAAATARAFIAMHKRIAKRANN